MTSFSLKFSLDFDTWAGISNNSSVDSHVRVIYTL